MLNDASRENRVHAEVLADALYVERLSLVSVGRAPGHHAQLRQLREIVDESIGHSIAEVFDLRIVRRVDEGKNRKRLHVAVSRQLRADHEGGNDDDAGTRDGGRGPPASRVPAFAMAAMFEISEVELKLVRRLIAVIRILRQTFANDSLELRGCARIPLRQRWSFRVYNVRDALRGRATAEWQSPRRHFVEDHAKAEDVATVIDGMSERLLGTHVRKGAAERPDHRLDVRCVLRRVA